MIHGVVANYAQRIASGRLGDVGGFSQCRLIHGIVTNYAQQMDRLIQRRSCKLRPARNYAQRIVPPSEQITYN